MNLELRDKVMIITGAERGIGSGIARNLTAEGGIAVIAGRLEKEGRMLEEELVAAGHRCMFIPVELTEEAQCRQAVEQTIRTFGRIDILVNNAGVNDGIGLENGNPDLFLKSVHRNVSHYYFMAHYCLPELKKNKGNIINISSKTGITGQGNNSGYIASKSAQLGLTREWAIELLKYGIRVNAVLPAEVMTELYMEWINGYENPEAKLASITELIPLENRMTRIEEIADAVIFLASARASHITGQYIHVDGGYVHLDRSLHTRQ